MVEGKIFQVKYKDYVRKAKRLFVDQDRLQEGA